METLQKLCSEQYTCLKYLSVLVDWGEGGLREEHMFVCILICKLASVFELSWTQQWKQDGGSTEEKRNRTERFWPNKAKRGNICTLLQTASFHLMRGQMPAQHSPCLLFYALGVGLGGLSCPRSPGVWVCLAGDHMASSFGLGSVLTVAMFLQVCNSHWASSFYDCCFPRALALLPARFFRHSGANSLCHG